MIRLLDGTYAIEADSPLGRKAGTVTIVSNGSKVDFDLDVPIIGEHHAVGSASGDSFKVTGVVRVMLLGKFECEVSGTVHGDDLQATVHTKKGNLPIVGVRIA